RSPANRQQLLTCPLDTGLLYSIPFSWPPLIRKGGVSPSTVAPIKDRGTEIRFIGRRESDSSPIRVQSIGREATSPLRSRIVVPLLPQSRGASGCCHSGGGISFTSFEEIHSCRRPSWFIQRRVDSQSSPRSGFRTTDTPFAIAASI